MRFPSKVTTFNDSILPKLPLVLKELQKEDIKPEELYRKLKRHLKNLKEFVEIIDSLYALGEIDIIDEEVLHYVKKD
ncbi:MAG: ABC-three component system middle component 7 [Erysipelotrichales bacterium]|nr:ABC-three component system middle component 7 [Erysipelotrichales bacterium]